MNDKVWNILMDNALWMENTNQFPDSYVIKFMNRFMRLIISLVTLVMNGKLIAIKYSSGDRIWIEFSWKTFKYSVCDVIAEDGEWVINGTFITDENFP